MANKSFGYFGPQFTYDEVRKLEYGDDVIYCNNQSDQTIVTDAKVLGQCGGGQVLVALDDINLAPGEATIPMTVVAHWSNLYHKPKEQTDPS